MGRDAVGKPPRGLEHDRTTHRAADENDAPGALTVDDRYHVFSERFAGPTFAALPDSP
jgi:hypothetical protein